MNSTLALGKLAAAVVMTAVLAGCIQAPYKELVYKNPYILDRLDKGGSIAVVEGGEFTPDGWRAGENGSLTYSLPMMTQGVIEIEASGLSLVEEGDVFLTLFEPVTSRYADPFVTKNPYLAKAAIYNHLTSPNTSFSLDWRIKDFPPGTAEDVYYSDEEPEAFYQDSESSGVVAIYPDELHTITLKWMNGKARMFVDGQMIVEHNYAPLIYNPDAIQLVIGKTPGAKQFAQENLTVKQVKVTFPGM